MHHDLSLTACGVWSWMVCSVNMVLGASGALWDRFSVFGAFSWVMEAVLSAHQ